MTDHVLEENSPELSMYIMLHQMGEAYGMLPSQLLAEGSTLDLVVFDAVMSYRQHQERKRGAPNEPPQNKPGDDNMKDAIHRMRSKE